ncbi:Transmembrane Protease Serine 11B [Manis pentadactyla]|nr:Transmembrane Protease Serine 11B [Manis pentadactyla]
MYKDMEALKSLVVHGTLSSLKWLEHRPVTAFRIPLPLWVIAPSVLGVSAVLGLTIGLLVNFLEVGCPGSNSVTAQIWLIFKAPRSMKENIRRRTESILRQVLRNHSGPWTTDPSSLRLTGEYPVLLQKAPVKIIVTNTCNARESYNGMIQDTML